MIYPCFEGYCNDSSPKAPRFLMPSKLVMSVSGWHCLTFTILFYFSFHVDVNVTLEGVVLQLGVPVC